MFTGEKCDTKYTSDRYDDFHCAVHTSRLLSSVIGNGLHKRQNIDRCIVSVGLLFERLTLDGIREKLALDGKGDKNFFKEVE